MVTYTKWASPEDFVVLFQYFWHAEFPIDPKAIGARRSDWTKHIDCIVGKIGRLFGYYVRYEAGGKRDAVYRNTNQDVIALEWEWDGVKEDELKKLKNHIPFLHPNQTLEKLDYSVLISYSTSLGLNEVCQKIQEYWKGADHSLLLIVINFNECKSDKYFSGRILFDMHTYIFESNQTANTVMVKPLRSWQAYPWKIPHTQWELIGYLLDPDVQ